jgi:hypothetical protein
MRLSTGLRVASIIIAAKTILIGLAYWGRAAMVGRPLHIGSGSWVGFLAIIAVVVVTAVAVYIAAPRFNPRD